MAATTRRTLSKVKSSAMMARHPSVPNFMGWAMSCLYKLVQPFFVQIFHDFSHVLGMGTGGDEQCISSFDYDQIVHANGGHKFARRMNVVPLSVQGEGRIAGNNIVMHRTRFGRVMLMERSPGTEIVPAEISRQAIQIRFTHAFCGTRLEHCVIHADVLALWIKFLESRGECFSAIGGGDFFQNCSGVGQMLTECASESFGTP